MCTATGRCPIGCRMFEVRLQVHLSACMQAACSLNHPKVRVAIHELMPYAGRSCYALAFQSSVQHKCVRLSITWYSTQCGSLLVSEGQSMLATVARCLVTVALYSKQITRISV